MDSGHMLMLAHTQSVSRQRLRPPLGYTRALYTLGSDTQPATLYQQLHQPSLQACQVPLVKYSVLCMSLLETSS